MGCLLSWFCPKPDDGTAASPEQQRFVAGGDYHSSERAEYYDAPRRGTNLTFKSEDLAASRKLTLSDLKTQADESFDDDDGQDLAVGIDEMQ